MDRSQLCANILQFSGVEKKKKVSKPAGTGYLLVWWLVAAKVLRTALRIKDLSSVGIGVGGCR